MMKKLTAYMDPEYLTADATFVQQQFQQEKIAFSVFWASRAGNLENPKESKVAGKMATAAAPRAVKGGVPAVQYSWDGWAIAKNITDAEAEAAFRIAVEGANADMVKKNNDVAVWLIDGFKPSAVCQGRDRYDRERRAIRAVDGVARLHRRRGLEERARLPARQEIRG